MRSTLVKTLSKISGRGWTDCYKKISEIHTADQLIDFREECLEKLLLHASENVPYYSQIFKKIQVVNNGKLDCARFQQIPYLKKEILKHRVEDLKSKDLGRRKWYWNASGGSTGEPTKFIQDAEYGAWAGATWKYFHEKLLGIDEEKAKKVAIWGSERDLFYGSIGTKAKLVNWLTNTVFLNSFRMTEQDMERYIGIINRHNPELVRGYAGALYEICRFASKKGIKISTPKRVVSQAETLTDEMRRTIEDTLGTKVFNFYGSREASSLAGECIEGKMHIFCFNNELEVADEGGIVKKEGEEGKVIITTLHNYSMPLIRYDVGDMAVVGPVHCKCGNLLPTLNKVSGRIIEHFLLKNGTVVPGEYFIHLIGVVLNKSDINKFQVIQEDYERVKINIVSREQLNQSNMKEIEDKIRLVMGNSCEISWNCVEDIDKTKSGKYIYTKSLVWR
ncbi:MAG: phenylacetate--CoA ligase family protein [Candidatus Methanosuratincola petrocarbonis]